MTLVRIYIRIHLQYALFDLGTMHRLRTVFVPVSSAPSHNTSEQEEHSDARHYLFADAGTWLVCARLVQRVKTRCAQRSRSYYAA
jgi:lipocalin